MASDPNRTFSIRVGLNEPFITKCGEEMSIQSFYPLGVENATLSSQNTFPFSPTTLSSQNIFSFSPASRLFAELPTNQRGIQSNRNVLSANLSGGGVKADVSGDQRARGLIKIQRDKINQAPTRASDSNPVRVQQQQQQQLGRQENPQQQLQQPREAMATQQGIRRKRRTIIYKQQKLRLEKEFESSKYPDDHKIEEVAGQLNMDTDVVKVWFKNRRTKFRKEENKRKSIQHQADPLHQQQQQPNALHHHPQQQLHGMAQPKYILPKPQHVVTPVNILQQHKLQQHEEQRLQAQDAAYPKEENKHKSIQHQADPLHQQQQQANALHQHQQQQLQGMVQRRYMVTQQQQVVTPENILQQHKPQHHEEQQQQPQQVVSQDITMQEEVQQQEQAQQVVTQDITMQQEMQQQEQPICVLAQSNLKQQVQEQDEPQQAREVMLQLQLQQQLDNLQDTCFSEYQDEQEQEQQPQHVMTQGNPEHKPQEKYEQQQQAQDVMLHRQLQKELNNIEFCPDIEETCFTVPVLP